MVQEAEGAAREAHEGARGEGAVAAGGPQCQEGAAHEDQGLPAPPRPGAARLHAKALGLNIHSPRATGTIVKYGDHGVIIHHVTGSTQLRMIGNSVPIIRTPVIGSPPMLSEVIACGCGDASVTGAFLSCTSVAAAGAGVGPCRIIATQVDAGRSRMIARYRGPV